MLPYIAYMDPMGFIGFPISLLIMVPISYFNYNYMVGHILTITCYDLPPVWLILVCFADLKHHSKQAGWWLANDMSQHVRGDQRPTTLESPHFAPWQNGIILAGAWGCLMFILIVRSLGLNLEHPVPLGKN